MGQCDNGKLPNLPKLLNFLNLSGSFFLLYSPRMQASGGGMTKLATSQTLSASLNAHLGGPLNGLHKAE